MTDRDQDTSVFAGADPLAGSRLFEAIFESSTDGSPEQFPVIGGYRLLRQVGEGSGGEVFEAARPGSDVRFALKVFRHGSGRSRRLQRAMREIDVTIDLRLPRVPRVYEHGEHDGQLYVVSEYIDGESIDAYCTKCELDTRQRVLLLRDVAMSVHRLHERGVIHRDIKPSNVIVDRNGEPWIIDLGVAMLLGESVHATLTSEGVPVGTPAFMAPEQARGERAMISTRSDVYSLGALACFILTDHTPHDVDTALHEAVRRVGQDPPRDPATLSGNLSADLSTVLQKAIARDPEARYESAAAMADDLGRWSRGERIHAKPQGAWIKLTSWMGRHPVMSTSAAFLAIVLIAAMFGWFLVQNIMLTPDRIAIDKQQRFAVLLSRSGHQLARWGNGEPRNIRGAVLVEPNGDDPRVIIATGSHTGEPYSGLLRCERINDPYEPVWVMGARNVDITSCPWPVKAGIGFAVHDLVEADVFKDLPGNELIAIHWHSFQSPTLLRIYSADGEVLWQVWHDGRIFEARWIDKIGQIAFVGVNTVCHWTERTDVEVIEPHRSALVLGTVTPTRGELAPGDRISTPGDPGALEPVSYLTLHPFELTPYFHMAALAPPFTGEVEGNSDAVLHVRGRWNKEATISWLVNFEPDGPRLSPVMSNDHYKQHTSDVDSLIPEGSAMPPEHMMTFGLLPPCSDDQDD